MVYDDERGSERRRSDFSAPKKRKRISTNEKYEKVKIGGSSPDGQRERRTNYDNDRDFSRKPYREGNKDYNRDYNKDVPRDKDGNIDGNTRYPSRSYDNSQGENRGFRKSYGQRDGNERPYRSSDRPSYNRDNKPYSRDNRDSRDSRDNRDNRDNRYSRDNRDNRDSRGERSFNRPDRPFNRQGGRPDWKQGGGKPFRRNEDRQPQRQPEYNFPEETNDNSPIRLNKFIANSGLCSRREADEHIQAGLIMINGQLVTELGVKVLPTDDIRYNGVRITPEKKVYILLNKPKDYVTSVDDPHAKRTIMELVKGACRERIYPVGRLDRMTTGVILLTNDGDLTKKLTHPTSEIKKIYQAQLDKNLKQENLLTIADGVTLDDGFIKVDDITYLKDKDKNMVGIEIHSGKNRIVRRIFESQGYKVVKLDRVFFAGLTKKGLSRGEWRYLAPREVGFLKMLKV
ncbi:MAG TPA: pseudouridine synthase [Bacteroidales bacterium]|nr:pseudouridine synthase [Bacteroidales bacterium]